MSRHVRVALALAALTVAATAAVAEAKSLWKFTTKGAYSYVTEPKLHPPKIATTLHGKRSQLAHGYFMFTNEPNLALGKPMSGQSGPVIYDSQMQPVWFMPVPRNVVPNNLTLQSFNGKPALSYWQGVVTSTGQVTRGKVYVIDQSYKTVATLTATAPWVLALHEFIISGHDAWAVVSRNVPGAAHGGPAGSTLVDTAVQEYDLTTGKLLYTWDPLDHVSTRDSYQKPLKTGIWDAYHLNSIDLTGHGTFLVSMRNTSAAYLIDQATGKVLWTLGGKHSSFKIDKKGQFAFQHDVRLQKRDVITMFDDHCCATDRAGKFIFPNGPSRGLELKLNFKKHTASYVSQASRGANFHTAFLGSDQLLSNGNTLVGWGSQPYFSEYSRSGKLILDAALPIANETYRVYLEHWIGKPSYPPKGAVRTKGSHATVYASWNGATQVAKWRVLGGNSASKLKTVASARRSGFETAIALSKSYKAYEVQALDSHGHVLGTSSAF
jgi:hypothetical protein